MLNVFSIGILFNALASGFVAAVSLALALFLWKRRNRLNLTMKAYAWFWWFTVLVWFPSSLRYLLIGFGYAGPGVRYLDIIVQTAIFFTGPTLFYYVIMRIFQSEKLANIIAITSFILGLMALWFILRPNGIPIRDVTAFSSDATINTVSFSIFSVQIGALIFLLLYDIFNKFQRWRKNSIQSLLYEALYPVAVIVYVVLGSVDESKIVTNWPLIAFRLLYSAAFLFVYLLIVQDESSQETYFINEAHGVNIYD